jgi:hypothetical protein
MTTFHISNLDRHTEDGFVTVAHWTASQTDGEYNASTYSTASFTKSDDMNLIPFETLTEDMVIGWVKASLGEEGVAAVDAALAQNIELQKNPVTATGTPWGQA